MKRIFLVFALMAFGTAAFPGDDIFSYIPYKSASWRSVIKVEGAHAMNLEQDVFFKGKKMRMEGPMKDQETGKQIKQIIIMTPDMTYVIFPEKKSGMKYSNKSMMNPEKTKNDYMKYRNKAVKTGQEKVNGVNCTVWEYEVKEDGMNIKVREWRGADGFIYRTQSEIIEGDKMKTTTDIKDLKKDIPIADSLFSVPEGIEMMDMDNMMGGKMKAPDEKNHKHSAGNGEDGTGKAAMDLMKGMLGQ